MSVCFGAILRGFALLLLVALLAFALLAWQIDRLGGRDSDALALGAPAATRIVVLGARVANTDGSPGSRSDQPHVSCRRSVAGGLAPHIICTGGFKNERLSAAAVSGVRYRAGRPC